MSKRHDIVMDSVILVISNLGNCVENIRNDEDIALKHRLLGTVIDRYFGPGVMIRIVESSSIYSEVIREFWAGIGPF